MKNTIIYLIGAPGTGKYTVANIIAEKTGATVIDNHAINNNIFQVLDMPTQKLPDTVFNYIDSIRQVILKSIVEISPKDKSFIFTNCLFDKDPDDYKMYKDMKELSQKRGAIYVPVKFLLGDIDEHKKRIASEDRGQRMKITNPEAAIKYSSEKYKLIEISHENLITIETTGSKAEEIADKIIAHVNKL